MLKRKFVLEVSKLIAQEAPVLSVKCQGSNLNASAKHLGIS